LKYLRLVVMQSSAVFVVAVVACQGTVSGREILENALLFGGVIATILPFARQANNFDQPDAQLYQTGAASFQ
jgi:hypothetical protein